MGARIYITGASGSGTSWLGKALARRLDVIHLDTDDYYWAPSETPFTVKRPIDERIALIAAQQLGQGGWVLSGSADGWGEMVLADAQLIIFLQTPTPLRLMRIRRREAAKFGTRIQPGGDMHHNHTEFLKWAASYDEPYFGGRSLTRHRDWLAGQNKPVLELTGVAGVDDLLAAVWARLRQLDLV